MQKKIKAKPKLFTKRSPDIPVTKRMLFEVRDELKAFTKSETQKLRAVIHGVKSEIHEMKSEIQSVRSEVHRLAVLVEEQNARIVLD